MASQYLARLGIVLGVDSGELVTGIEAAKKQFKDFSNQVEKDTKAAVREFDLLKTATEDYGKTLTKVEQIEREINKGRFMFAAQNVKDKLLEQAKAYDAQAASMKKMNGALTEQQKMAVTYQLTDFFTQIASGQNAMIAFIQQGGQLKDQMGGVGAAFRAVTSLLTPMRVALGGVAGAIGAIGFAYYQGSEESKKFNQAMAVTNQFAGMSIDRFTDLGQAMSREFNVAIGESRMMLQQLVASGQFTSTSLISVAQAISRIASLSGESADSVASKLIPSFDGSTSSAKKLNDTYHFLTLAQLKQIETLEKQGKMQQAAALTADLLNDSLKQQEVRLGYIEKLWKGIKDSASDFWDWAKSIGREKDPLREQLDDQVKLMESFVRMGGESATKGVRYQAALAEYKRLAAEIDKQEQEKQKKAEDKAAEKGKIDDYLATGGSERSVQMQAKLRKTLYETAIEQLKVFASEEERIRLDSLKKIADKAIEFEAQSSQEKRARGAELQAQLNADIDQINAERDRKIADLQYKRYLKELELQAAAMHHQEELDRQLNQKKIDAELNVYRAIEAGKDEVNLQKDILKIQMSLIGATETEKNIAEERLKIEKEIAQWKRTEEYGLLSEKDKEYYEKQKRGMSEAKIENMKFAESLKYMQGMYDAVWSNMSSAIENFVRTGKFSIKDFTRSVIQDMLIMNMKLQAMTLIRGFLRSFVPYNAQTTIPMQPGGGYADGGNPPVGVPSLVGERGPEIFIPRTAGTIIPNNKIGDLGGSTNITNNYINAIDTKSFEQRLLESSNTIWAGYTYANKTLASNGRRA